MGYLHFYSGMIVSLIVRISSVLVPYGVSTFLFDISIKRAISTYNSSRPLWGIYISIPCPRYPLFVKGLFSTLRRKIFF